MAKHYVTFGFDHAHSVNGKTLDKDTVAVFEAQTSQEGRDKAFEYFGPKFCFDYHEETWDEERMEFFPKGYVYLEQ